MQSIFFLLLITLQSQTPDFSVTLSYHPAPFYYQEWFITIVRAGTQAYIETNSLQYIRKKRSIPADEYASLVEKLISLGIWNCKDCYTYGNYYILEISKGNYRHKCKIEYSSSVTCQGNANQIIRLIVNTANYYLQ